MTDTNVQTQEQPKTVDIQSDPEAARYEALEKELADEGGEGAPEADKATEKPSAQRGVDGKSAKASEKPVADETDGKAKEGEQPKAKFTPEELERNYNNTQAALREERARRQALEERLNGFTEAVAQLRERKAQKAESEAPQIPDVNENPIGHFQAIIEQQNRKIAELEGGTKKTAEELESDRTQREFWNVVVNSEAKMRETAPDYDDAVQHLEAGRVSELQVMFPDDDPQAQALARQYNLPSVEALRSMVLDQDRVTVAQMALRLGKSPAQMYYDLAQKRGYVKAAKPNGKANGKSEAEEKIETVRRGKNAAKSIGGGEGGKADNPLSLADLADLYDEDPDEADKVFDQMKRQGLLG